MILMNLLKIIFLILNLFLFADCNAGGFVTWEQTTPGNNTIYHDDGPDSIRIYCKAYPYYDANNLIISNIRQWYFKKNYIIGEYFLIDTTNNLNKINSYFIFNEPNCTIEIFTSKDKWLEKIYLKGLNNIIWVRKHNTHWGFYQLRDFGKAIFFLTIGIPFIILYLILILVSIFRYKFKLKNLLTIINLTIGSILFLLYLGDLYPYSI